MFANYQQGRVFKRKDGATGGRIWSFKGVPSGIIVIYQKGLRTLLSADHSSSTFIFNEM